MSTASPILTNSEHRCSIPGEARSSVALPLLATALLHTAIAAMLWQGWAPASPSPAAQARPAALSWSTYPRDPFELKAG